MALAQSELDVHMESFNYEQNRLNEIKRKLDDLRNLETQRNEEINELLKNLPQMEKEINECTSQLNNLTQREKILDEKIRKNRDKYAEARSSFAANGNKNNVLKFLMQLKSEGKIPGIFGRLGDLGAIDERFDVAISTACGALDCILVDTVDTAQKCVEYLKRHNVGVGNFIALDKQEKWREYLKRKNGYPEDAPRLVDLIKVNDETILTAFYSSLRNTLVANNITQANRIGYGEPRYRVVTIEGAIIEISGTMSGGGRPLKGRMGNKIVEEQTYTEQQVKEMERSIEQDKNELEEVQREKQELTDKIFNLKSKYESSKDNLNRWKQELKSIVEQKNSLQKGEVEAMKKLNSIKLDENVNRKLEQAINKHKKDYEEAEKVAGKCRDKIEELNQNILDINKRILDKPKENLAKIDDEIKQTNDQLTNLSVEIKSASRNLATSEKKLESMLEDFELNENKEKECNERFKQIDEEGRKLIEEHDELKEELDEIDKKLKEKLKANKNAEKQTQDLEMKKIDLQHELEKLHEKLNKDESDLKNYIRASEKLKLHQVDLNFYDKPTEPLKQYSAEELEEVDIQLIMEQTTDIEDELKKMTPNLTAIQSYIELVSK